MPRAARIVVPGAPHHITQRGNNRQAVFFVDDDRRAYLEMLLTQARRFAFRVVGYCLMTNHVHVIGVPEQEESLAKAIGRTHFLYAQYVNRLHGRSGHLWQNRFYSCPMDEPHAWNALAYAELNPVRAAMVRRAWQWPWSSAAVHCGQDGLDTAGGLTAWRSKISPQEWKATLTAVARNQAVQNDIRRATHTGRPLGSDSFLSKVEHRLGRRVRALPIGRPKSPREPAEGGK